VAAQLSDAADGRLLMDSEGLDIAAPNTGVQPTVESTDYAGQVSEPEVPAGCWGQATPTVARNEATLYIWNPDAGA
jgi:hypothetical protein